MRRPSRKPLPKATQVKVFRRDGWLCRWCGRPVVFPLAMKALETYARADDPSAALAYFDPRWRRDAAPLLDHLGAVVDDHVEAFSQGGAHDESNFVTACNKCNMRKNSGHAEQFQKRAPRLPIKGKYGEPTRWDGLSAVFVAWARPRAGNLTPNEADWFRALADGR